MEYTVVFKDENGTIISTKTYYYGADVVVPNAPSKAADNTYTYTFAGWDKEVVDCVADATYTATYTPVYINYTIKQLFSDRKRRIIWPWKQARPVSRSRRLLPYPPLLQ